MMMILVLLLALALAGWRWGPLVSTALTVPNGDAERPEVAFSSARRLTPPEDREGHRCPPIRINLREASEQKDSWK